MALVNSAARREIEGVVRRVEKVETATEPRFQEHFVSAIAVPHKTAPHPHLASQVTLPEIRFESAPEGEEGGRRRRRRRG